MNNHKFEIVGKKISQAFKQSRKLKEISNLKHLAFKNLEKAVIRGETNGDIT